MKYLASVLLIVLASPVFAQVKDGGTAVTPLPQAWELDLTVSANPAPAPLLSISLLPPARDKSPGNAALGYYRAITLQPAWPRDPEARRKLGEQLIQWEELPVDKLPVKEIAEYLKQHRHAFRAVDEAARLDHIDWQLRGDRTEEIGATIEGIQGFRELARFLKLRFRYELAENRPQEALRTIQTTLQMGKHLAEGSNLIQMLVGIAIVHIGLGEVRDFITHPAAPNLYWALATLPRPLIDPRPALDGESRLTLSFISGLKLLESGPVSEAEANRALQDSFKLLTAANAEGNVPVVGNIVGAFGMAAAATNLAPQARKDLIAWGWAEKTVEAMPNAQVVLLRAAAQQRRIWDEQAVQFYLPYPKAAAHFKTLPKQLEDLRRDNPKDTLLNVFSLVFPAMAKCHDVHTRTDRMVAELQTVEALRLYAASSLKRWPVSLDEIKMVPVPLDPITGKPFEYKLDGDTAKLLAVPPVDEKANLANAHNWILHLRR